MYLETKSNEYSQPHRCQQNLQIIYATPDASYNLSKCIKEVNL